MDALAAYGSSSESDDDSCTPNQMRFNITNRSAAPKTSRGRDGPAADKGGDAATSTPPTSPERSSGTSASSPSKKRPRVDHDLHGFLSTNRLPRPNLQKEISLCSCSVDYMSTIPIVKVMGDASTNPHMEYTKFQSLSKSLSSEKSWAAQLREQTEFHNPNFFQSVVEYFQIDDPLGSHVDPSGKNLKSESTPATTEIQQEERVNSL
ncbi:HCNGP-like protein [Nitzschia inconspicua]|uniref:HCNGP-like protein n=1 Tax=Nitzschia inconspicua TaxID=303405 RepID=A0A9K3PNV1_9STRA|nr:HCNGP-like protein [Nitzschia inconspicua]